MRYAAVIVLHLCLLVFGAIRVMADEDTIPRFDASIEIVSSTNTGGASAFVQYSAVLRNDGSELIDEMRVRLHSPNASFLTVTEPNSELINIYRDWLDEGLTKPISLEPSQAIHIPFIAYVTKPGGSTPIHAELDFLNDEVSSNNKSTVYLHTLESHRPALLQDGVMAIEAESFDFQTPSSLAAVSGRRYQIPKWHLNSVEVSSEKQPDPDSASPVDASAGAYVETLPDIRVNDFEAPIFGISNFDQNSHGPVLNYIVYLNEPGRYYFFARIRATNNQDNTIYVSLDHRGFDSDNKQAVGVCSPDGNWQWASKNEQHCDLTDSVIFDIETAGLYRLNVYMEDDGTELDKLVLQHNNNIAPLGSGPDAVVYEGSVGNIYMHFWSSHRMLVLGDTLTLNVEIGENTATTDPIEISNVVFDVDPTLLESWAGFESCENADGKLKCAVNHRLPNIVQSPQHPQDDASVIYEFPDNPLIYSNPLSITLKPKAAGNLTVSANVEADVLPPMLRDAFFIDTYLIKSSNTAELVNSNNFTDSDFASATDSEVEGGGAFTFEILFSLLGFLSFKKLNNRFALFWAA